MHPRDPNGDVVHLPRGERLPGKILGLGRGDLDPLEDLDVERRWP